MGRLIVVLSEKGNVGKSNIACSLAFSLKSLEKKVLLIDSNPYRDLSFLLGIGEDTVFNFCDVVFNRCELSFAVNKSAGFDFLPAGEKLPPCTKVGETLGNLCNDYDYVIYDLPSSNGYLDLLGCFPEFIAVMPVIPSKSGVWAATTDARIILEKNNINGYFVLNRFSTEKLKEYGGNIDTVIDTVSLPLLGIIPDVNIASSTPAYKSAPFKNAVLRIAKRINGTHVPLPKISKI